MIKLAAHAFIGLLIATLAFEYFRSGGLDRGGYPQRPVRVIVPFNPGGGTDSYVRILQKAIRDNELMPQPLVIMNKPGGGATIGSTYVKDARNDGYTMLCLHEALLTSKITGQSPHGPEAFEAVAATGEVEMLVVVNEGSPFRSLADFMEKASESPETLKFGMNFGTPTHFACIQLENTVPGARFRLVSAGGGANRLAALMGGHLDAGIFSIGEFMRFRSNGLRALGYLSEDRIEELPEIATAEEQGFPVYSSNLQYWWFPKGTDPKIISYMANVFERAVQTDYVRRRSEELHIDPVAIVGRELEDRIERKMREFGDVQMAHRLELPDLAFWAIVSAGVFGITLLVKRFRAPQGQARVSEDVELRYDLALGVSAICISYILLMGLGILSFVWATILFLLGSGLYLTRLDKRRMVYVLETALLFPFGLHFVFTQVFTIQLP